MKTTATDKPESRRNANKFQAFRRALYSKNGITYKRFWKLFKGASMSERAIVIDTLNRVKSYAKIWHPDGQKFSIEYFFGTNRWHAAIWGEMKWLKITIPASHKVMSLEEVALWMANRKDNCSPTNPRPLSRHERSYVGICRVEGGDTMTARDLFNFANAICKARFPREYFLRSW